MGQGHYVCTYLYNIVPHPISLFSSTRSPSIGYFARSMLRTGFRGTRCLGSRDTLVWAPRRQPTGHNFSFLGVLRLFCRSRSQMSANWQYSVLRTIHGAPAQRNTTQSSLPPWPHAKRARQATAQRFGSHNPMFTALTTPSLLASPPIYGESPEQDSGEAKHACRGQSIPRRNCLLPMEGQLASLHKEEVAGGTIHHRNRR